MRVLICGGGVIGASLAFFLSRRGIRATVVERAGLACAASGKAGGFLALDWCDGTPLAAKGRAEKPAAAWTPEQTVDFMMERLAEGDFYILCPDNDVPRALDERRILWAAGDIVENRPALSRWHPDHKDAFAAFTASS